METVVEGRMRGGDGGGGGMRGGTVVEGRMRGGDGGGDGGGGENEGWRRWWRGE